uniref:Uncharacterized protein n=1 Tax=Picea glauca TaxID=3330 RepID=A0A101M0E9_PICGL|nr:hypothetical protein ABT39_MTgene4613 [Picea glauca]
MRSVCRLGFLFLILFQRKGDNLRTMDKVNVSMASLVLPYC